jgi:hypothetical protein
MDESLTPSDELSLYLIANGWDAEMILEQQARADHGPDFFRYGNMGYGRGLLDYEAEA